MERHGDRATASIARHPDVTGILASLQSAAPSVLVEEGDKAPRVRRHGRDTVAQPGLWRQCPRAPL